MSFTEAAARPMPPNGLGLAIAGVWSPGTFAACSVIDRCVASTQRTKWPRKSPFVFCRVFIGHVQDIILTIIPCVPGPCIETPNFAVDVLQSLDALHLSLGISRPPQKELQAH